MTANKAKFFGAALLMASIFWLVLVGKVDSALYVSVALSILTGLGVHASTVTLYNKPQ